MEQKEQYVSLSKFLSMILRHKPEQIGIVLDQNGWADVEELMIGMKRSGKHINTEILKQIVAEDSKKRYQFSEDYTKIRACQGHSFDVDLNLIPSSPPNLLYHGTSEKAVDSIKKQGIQKRQRQYVHLSKDIETAVKVGSRHGKVAVLKIDTKAMAADGFIFYCSENGVWLCEEVPWKYITCEEH